MFDQLILYKKTMNNHSQHFSPQTPRQKSHHSIIIMSNFDTQHSHIKQDKIADLYSKFLTINNQVSIDHDLSAFNMIEYNSRELKMDFDQQLIVAKLKRLENNAELKRINMELQNRRKKVHKHKDKDFQILPEKDKYMNTYRQFTQQRTGVLVDSQNHTDSEDEGRGDLTERPKGITFFNQLKKHPKVLEYTVEQIRSKEQLKKQLVNSKRIKVIEFRNQIRNLGHVTAFKMRKQKEKNTSKDKDDVNPQKLAENIFRKIYTKRNKQRSIDEIKRDKRLSHFVNKQQMIIDTIDQRSLSKELYKKLKERMNDIATELYLDERKHVVNSALPKVRMNKTINIMLK